MEYFLGWFSFSSEDGAAYLYEPINCYSSVFSSQIGVRFYKCNSVGEK